MSKKVVHSETKEVCPEPFNSLLPGPRYKTENTHDDGSKVTGYGDSKSESKRAASEKSSSSGGICFITTACVEAVGLPDDCDELQILRKFRDEYVQYLNDGKEMLNHYYSKSSEIVSAISRSDSAKEEYHRVFQEVQETVSCILAGQESKAVDVYRQLVQRLEKTYLS